MSTDWLSRLRTMAKPGLSARIAMTIIAALVSVQLLAMVLFFLGAREPGPIMVYGGRWLADAAEAAVEAAFKVEPDKRDAALDALPHAKWLAFDWDPDFRTPPHELTSTPMARLVATLKEKLGGTVRSVHVVVRRPGGRPPGPPGPYHLPGAPEGDKDRSVIFVPPEAADMSPAPALAPGEDIQVPGRFFVAIEGHDGTWITMQPPRNEPRGAWPLVINLAGAGLVIAALSAWTSRRILKPLDTLSEAAERLGRARVVTPVPEKGLGEFGVIARAFNDMQQRISQYVDERTRILAAMSHDLRTPLTRLRMMADYIKDDQQRLPLLREMSEMEAMISATMSFASHDAEAEVARKTDLAAMLISLCDELNDLGLDAHYSGPDHALSECQALSMKRALRNILENAVKYGEAADVTLKDTGDRIVVEIKDNGPGIPEDQFEFVFAPFRRLEPSRNKGTGGVGLGLTIARDVIRAHGGTITLANVTNNGGLVVTVTLPVVA